MLMRIAAILGVVAWCVTAPQAFAQDKSLSITLVGQSMIRSDLRAMAPGAVPTIKNLIQGDVKFTNFEGTVFEQGQSVAEGRGFLAPEAALDALKSFGFNLLSLSNNHAFDLKGAGLANTLKAVSARAIVHAGTGNSMAEAAAPAYLKTPNGTVALVASASGLMAAGARATQNAPGVNELRIEAGAKENEATAELPSTPGNSPNKEDTARILGMHP
jgi:poly-gamma-glutamate capsule biosynthesis protein CapA/YwtB (metallophosphatase superfamily)